MRRAGWSIAVVAVLGVLAAACERVVDLTPFPDGSGGPDTSVPDAPDDGDGGIEDAGIEDADIDGGAIPDAP